ncbi:MAG: hypothetical protein ACJA07_001505 [Rhodococcus sp. (in: high G+C Gram-positive bacteria)]|jgi:hypothetical protein
MTLDEARKLAADYPETSGIGRDVAAFAAGSRVSYERFMSDLDMLATEHGSTATVTSPPCAYLRATPTQTSGETERPHRRAVRRGTA